MKSRELGPGLISSALGFGAMGLSQGYGPTDDGQSVRLLQEAADLGVTLFDTAMSYGRGHNEELVGRALAGRRDQVLLATKFGIVRTADGVSLDARPDNVRTYLEASLRRLGTDHVDLYYLHRVDPTVPIADTVGAMAELQVEGLTRHLGVSEVTPDQLEQAAAVHPITAVQFEWSLAWRQPETDVVPAARRLGVGLVPYSPLGRGLLTGTIDDGDIAASPFRKDDGRFRGAAWETNRARVATLAGIAARSGRTPGQLALAWLLAQGEDVVPIPGTRRPERLRQNVAAADRPLGDDELATLDAVLAGDSWAGDRTSFAVPVTARPAPAGDQRS